MDKTDCKKNKAVQYLDEALLLLLQKKSYDRITVKNLIDKAGISRTSFYANFVDIQDFFSHVVGDCFSDLKTYTGRYSYNLCLKEDFLQYYVKFYIYMGNHAELFAAMMGDNGLPSFRLHLIQEATSMWTDQFAGIRSDKRVCSQQQKDETELLITYIVSAHVGLVRYWLFDHRHLSPDYMAEMLFELTWTILNTHGYEKYIPASS